MATREKVDDKFSVLVLSPGEAVELIALLTAQLGECTLKGRMSGEAPEIRVEDRGTVLERIGFIVKTALVEQRLEALK